MNIVATYGLSLFRLAVGLACGRWTLMALGEVNYGLLGVIGGLMIFIDYFNTMVVGAISRFYSISVGKERSDPVGGLEECHRWFTTAVLIQLTWPTLLLIVGYPIGLWAIHNFLTIPPDRIEACIWVWRFSCTASYISMITVPLKAMYNSKQYIAELTLYSFATITLNALFSAYMVTHPGDWLTRASLWGCLLGIIPGLIIAFRAIKLFPECRFKMKYVKCLGGLKELGSYGFWNAFGILGSYLKGQGLTIVVNKFFGPRINAGMAIGQTVAGQCDTLSASLAGAFSPAIYNAWGSGDHDKARTLANRVNKIGVFLTMIFAVPMILEVKEVLTLWLKNPPPFAADYCVFILTYIILDKISEGHLRCVDANGKIARYQVFESTFRISVIPISLLLIWQGVGADSVGWSLIVSYSLCAFNRVYWARRLADMSVMYWLRCVLLPLVIVSALGLTIGYLPRLFLPASFWRVCVTTLFVEATILPISWFFVLDAGEKEFILAKLRPMVKGLKGLKGLKG